MRQVVLDTETTGLEVSKGHRVIEIGCVELINRRGTGETYHQRVQPDRDIDEAAEGVHGISSKMLADKPRFGAVAEAFIEFISGAELIIHNADFDVGFLDNEFQCAGLHSTNIASVCTVIDTLQMAREIHPGQRNSLDALCKEYHVDNSGRDFHGALLDAQLLADVYLAMTGGQGALPLERENVRFGQKTGAVDAIDRSNLKLVVLKATEADLAAHVRQLDLIEQSSEDGAVWPKLER
ncbi:MAG: DNA polymerase III subunit epsilon [Gammaproteobacteria bacterium]|jgi:DNA polymerase-3 subunit epsilon|nr:DNA polymerase III subunit epsilon [Gammaproteobacteria bacterium]